VEIIQLFQLLQWGDAVCVHRQNDDIINLLLSSLMKESRPYNYTWSVISIVACFAGLKL
jgi:hypothetical protein